MASGKSLGSMLDSSNATGTAQEFNVCQPGRAKSVARRPADPGAAFCSH